MRVPPAPFTLSIIAAFVLAACAHTSAPVSYMSNGGEVSRTLAAAPAPARQGATYQAITRDELAPVASTELWNGTYRGRTYSQHGALALVLSPSTTGPLHGVVAWRVARVPVNGSASGPVELVRVPVTSTQYDGERFVLRSDEYFDPACNCTARATFRGTLRGDTLSGQFSIDGAATVVGEEHGKWRVVRVP